MTTPTPTRTPTPVTQTGNGSGDHERFAHYVQRDEIADALVFGNPIRALCGKVWVPSRDPDKFPICPTCKEIRANLPE